MIRCLLVTGMLVAAHTGLAATHTFEQFTKALHQVESSGAIKAPVGDGGKAIGPLQIHKGYWQDAVDFDKTIGGKYQDCQGLEYSIKVVRAYMARYAKKAFDARDWHTCARIHNGGPTGHKRPSTLGYWTKVQRAL